MTFVAIALKGGSEQFVLKERRRLSGPAMRTFGVIADVWGLTLVERRGLLGNPPNVTFRRWLRKAQDDRTFALTASVLKRISAIFGVHRALITLCPSGYEARDWLHRPHQTPPFTGRRPLDLMISGELEGLLAVQRFLNAARQGIYMPPNSIDEDFRPYDEDEIVIVEMSTPSAPRTG